MTLRMKPLVFQFALSGWTIFAVFVHRAISVWLPRSASVRFVSH
jgi:hypothetical protein